MNAVETFIGQQNSEHTQRAYRLDLNRWFEFLGRRDPSPAVVTAFKNSLTESLSPASAYRVFAACRSYYRWIGGPNPFDRVKSPTRITNKLPSVPTDISVDRLLAVIDTSDVAGKKHRAVIALMLNGLRASEVADLRKDAMWYEKDHDAWVLRVTGKGLKERTIPVLPEVVVAIKAFQKASKVKSLWLLHDYDGSKLTYPQVEFAVRKWGKVAGLQGMHPHALRHHYGTRLARNGVSVFHLMQLMGHARPETTNIYVSLDMTDLIGAAKKDPRQMQ